MSLRAEVSPQAEATRQFRRSLHAAGWDDLTTEHRSNEVCIRVRQLPPAVSTSDCDWVVACGPDEGTARANVLTRLAGMQRRVS